MLHTQKFKYSSAKAKRLNLQKMLILPRHWCQIH